VFTPVLGKHKHKHKHKQKLQPDRMLRQSVSLTHWSAVPETRRNRLD
jgi:hypothetical protein